MPGMVFFMPPPPNSVGKGIMFLGCPVCLSDEILLPRYLVNNLDSIIRENSVAPSYLWLD